MATTPYQRSLRIFPVSKFSNPVGTHMLRHTGMCRPSELLFHQKSLDMGPILVKIILRRGSHFTKIAKKSKISRILGRKPLRNGSRFAKISGKKSSNQPLFEEQNP